MNFGSSIYKSKIYLLNHDCWHQLQKGHGKEVVKYVIKSLSLEQLTEKLYNEKKSTIYNIV